MRDCGCNIQAYCNLFEMSKTLWILQERIHMGRQTMKMSRLKNINFSWPEENTLNFILLLSNSPNNLHFSTYFKKIFCNHANYYTRYQNDSLWLLIFDINWQKIGKLIFYNCGKFYFHHFLGQYYRKSKIRAHEFPGVSLEYQPPRKGTTPSKM